MKEQDKWLLYSTCDEDSNSELRALDITPEDRVLSVTGSGCRTLSLLTRNPRSVVSVDYAPGQNHLLELKLAAIRSLPYDTLLAFLGVEECDERWEFFRSIEAELSPEARAYFQRYRPAIEKGVLFSGRHEQFYIRFVAPLIHLLYGCHFKRIFGASSIEEQSRVYKDHISGGLWRWLIRSGFSEAMIRLVLNDKKYRISIDVDSVGDYILERLEHTLSNHLARDNHWLSFMLNGRYLDRKSLPHFLLYESYLAIREATTDVRIVTGNLVDYAKTLPDMSIDKFSLSDVTSCIDGEQFDALIREVVRSLKVGGRVCYRNFLARHSPPRESWSVMQRDDALCSLLYRDDLAFVYSFEVARRCA